MKLILATDGTEASEGAVHILSKLDLTRVSEIRVLTVIDMALPLAHDIYSGMITNTVEIEEAARKEAKKSIAETISRISALIGEAGTQVTSNTVVGSPESQIVEEAEKMGADLIVVGSHGYNRWERLLLGSVSDSVIHHAPCSVLVVRTKVDE
ncbi:MAG: universal stress protein [Acidobacteriota bacterium]|nr:universal stress protein [Acidobacteriota bacterium]MDH3529169.1 universal stress protein [Acidobacteriota bacterium]